jgi:hypothetical protein
VHAHGGCLVRRSRIDLELEGLLSVPERFQITTCSPSAIAADPSISHSVSDMGARGGGRPSISVLWSGNVNIEGDIVVLRSKTPHCWCV